VEILSWWAIVAERTRLVGAEELSCCWWTHTLLIIEPHDAGKPNIYIFSENLPFHGKPNIFLMTEELILLFWNY